MHRLLRLGLGSFLATSTVIMLGVVNRELRMAPRSQQTVTQLEQTAAPIALAGMVPPAPQVRVIEDHPTPLVMEPEDVVSDAPGTWAPPTWFPAAQRDALWTLNDMSRADGPEVRSLRLHSRSVFVYDLDTGEVLLSRNADDRRPVASLTKVVSALTLASTTPDLDREICVDSSMRPSWPGAVTRLRTGTCMTGWDLLGAALVRSDNLAAYTFPEVAGLPHYPFVGQMNQVAADLHMDQSSFSDPSGVEDDNLATARDMTRAIFSASQHPVLAPVVSAPFWDVWDRTRRRGRRLFTTDRLVGRKDLDVLAAKTGYTDTARNCFMAVIQTRSGHHVALTTLGAWRSRHRWTDVVRILDWLNGR